MKTKIGPALTVVGISTGALIGGGMGAFGLGLPGIGWAIVAAMFGIALGSYAGAVVGGLFGSEPEGEEETTRKAA